METAGHGEKGEGDGGKGTAAGGLLCSCMYFVRMVLCNICMHVCVHVCMYVHTYLYACMSNERASEQGRDGQDI